MAKKDFALKGKEVGGYRILEEIAEGGFGITYKALHIEANKLVCIKQSKSRSKEDEQLLRDEMGSIWDLRHGAIPAIRDIIRFDGKLALVMSYVPGETLEQTVERIGGPLDPEAVVWITERLLNALWYLHDNDVIHGDIKPANVIIQEVDHTVVLVDFGLAMVKPKPDEDSKGYTEYFSPPEQKIGGVPLVAGSDFYSLGMTIIYALSGTLDCVEKKQVPTDVPDLFCNFINKLIVRNVDNRPKSARVLFEELRELRKKVFGHDRSGMKPITGVK